MQGATPANEEEEETLPGVEEVVPGGAAVAWLVNGGSGRRCGGSNDGERDLFSVALFGFFSVFGFGFFVFCFLFVFQFIPFSFPLPCWFSLSSVFSLSPPFGSLFFFSFGFLLYL